MVDSTKMSDSVDIEWRGFHPPYLLFQISFCLSDYISTPFNAFPLLTNPSSTPIHIQTWISSPKFPIPRTPFILFFKLFCYFFTDAKYIFFDYQRQFHHFSLYLNQFFKNWFNINTNAVAKIKSWEEFSAGRACRLFSETKLFRFFIS